MPKFNEIALTKYHALPYNFPHSNFGGSNMVNCNRVINSIIKNAVIFTAFLGLFIIMRTVAGGNVLNL